MNEEKKETVDVVEKVEDTMKEESTKATTVERALEEKVKLSIAVIGVGNAGNQNLNKCKAEGFDVFAINTSMKDLSDSVVSEHIHSFIAGKEARGAGKNRTLAKKLFKSNGRDLFNNTYFMSMIQKSDVIFVCGSTAGGTGSGIAPTLMNYLEQAFPSKIFIYYGILPRLTDSVMAQYNTIDCLNEIIENKSTYALADLEYFKNIPNDQAYEQIGNHIVESIKVISGTYLNSSKSGMIDENDMKTIVGEKGYISIYSLNKITQTDVDAESIQSRLIKLINNSPAVMIPRDGIVKEMGVIVNMPEEMNEASKSGDYTELTNYIGTPLSIFENYAINNKSVGQFIVILSGMNLPYNRILAAKEIITKSEEILKRSKDIDLQQDLDEYKFIGITSASSRLLEEHDDDENKRNDLLNSLFD